MQIDRNMVASGYIRSALLTPYVVAAEKMGVDTDKVLRERAVTEDALQDPERMVHADTFYACLNELATAADEPHLGFGIGDKMGFEEWPPFRRSVEEARTLGEALNLMFLEVPREANSVSYQMIVSGADAVFRVTRFVQSKNSPQQTEGFGAAFFVRILRAASGTAWDPSSVIMRTCFSDAMPKRPYGVRVEAKSAGALELVFPASWLFDKTSFHGKSFRSSRDQIPRAPDENVSLMSALQAAARPLLHKLDLNLQDIANALGIAPNELNRQLRLSGTTASKEIRRLRIDEAKASLAGEEPIQTISQRLGYSDPAHFSRFFRSQTGMSPRGFRSSFESKG